MNDKTAWFQLGLALVAFVGLAACGSDPQPTATLAPTLAQAITSPSPAAQTTVVSLATSIPSAAPSPTATATVPPAPSPTPSVTPTDTPPPYPRLRQLTSGGCCTNPFWSADGREVQFIDKPPGRPLGVYGVDATQPQMGLPALKTSQIDYTSSDGSLRAYLEGDQTVVERVATGEEYPINNGGRYVAFSPDNRRLLWLVIGRQGNFDQRTSQVWVANVDGSEAAQVATIKRFGPVEWLDDERLLVSGLPGEGGKLTLAVLTLSDGSLVTLALTGDDRGLSVSPGGSWLVYYLAFQDDPANDGIWLAPTDGSSPPRRFPIFGSYRWRDDNHLLYIPMEPGVSSHSLWEYDVSAEVGQRLTDPAQIPFEVANGDWQVSPDGRYVVFVNAADHNLWLIDLGP